MITDYKNNTDNIINIVIFNSVFCSGQMVELSPNQIISTSEQCCITVVKDFAEAQSTHVGIDIEDTTIHKTIYSREEETD